jgi:hypothetical protein
MKHVHILILCAAIPLGGCGVRLAGMNDTQKAELLAAQQGKLSDISDPVDKTRTYIVISQILLDFATGAAQEGDTAAMNSLLEQYVDAISAARHTIADSDRDPLRRPAGYKDLELSLRQHARILRDVADILSFDERTPVDDAIDVANSARREMLRLLFPQGPPVNNLLRR